jgi:hypothetical protein
VEPSYFVRAKRNDTEVKIPVYAVPELIDSERAAKYGRKAKTAKQSAFAMKAGFIRDGWENVAVLGPDTRVING